MPVSASSSLDTAVFKWVFTTIATITTAVAVSFAFAYLFHHMKG